MIMITLFPICYLSQFKDLDMNVIVLGKHASLPSFVKLRPSGLWELKNVTSYMYIHYVILNMYICNFRLLFYSIIYSIYSSCFSQINLMKTAPIESIGVHLPTPRYGQYLTHAHNHITPAAAAMDSCFALVGARQHGITVGSMSRITPRIKDPLLPRCVQALL